jgi:hypothetical protein
MSKNAGFLKMMHAFIDSTEFREASDHGKSLLLLLWRRFNGRNNGKIPCSVREAAAWCHCSRSAAARYFAELIDLGLLRATSKGHFTGDGRRDRSTEWLLTFLPRGKGETDAA